jgi:YfiR/HmsC-like
MPIFMQRRTSRLAVQRGSAWGALLLCATLGWPHLTVGAAAPTPEYLIKAAYLYKFALFVDWPADAFASRQAPITIGIIGTDPFDTALDRTVQNKRINDRPVVARRLQWNQDLRQCHILFVSASEASRTDEIVARLQGLPVLIVGETPEFAQRVGSIGFAIDQNKVKLEVNLEHAKRARLNISANLLRVARIVSSR